jgi:hypothetical protein
MVDDHDSSIHRRYKIGDLQSASSILHTYTLTITHYYQNYTMESAWRRKKNYHPSSSILFFFFLHRAEQATILLCVVIDFHTNNRHFLEVKCDHVPLPSTPPPFFYTSLPAPIIIIFFVQHKFKPPTLATENIIKNMLLIWSINSDSSCVVPSITKAQRI